jgi:fibronectin-binding autotransporter adhesin
MTTLRSLIGPLVLAGPLVCAQTITTPYTTSTGGALTNGTQSINNDGSTTFGAITVDTAAGISGGIQNFNGSSILTLSGVGTITGGIQNFAGNSNATGTIGGGAQNFNGANTNTDLSITGGIQNFAGSQVFFAGASSISGGTQTISSGQLYWQSTGAITGGTMTLQNGSQFYISSGSIAGADITLQNGAQFYNWNLLTNFSSSTTRITFDASSNGGGNGGGNGGQLSLYGKSTTLGRISSIASGGQIHGGASTGTTNTLTVNFDATTSTYGGTIVEGGPGGSGGSLALVKSGTGTLVLSGNNSYLGGTTVTACTLLATNSTGSALGSGPVTVNSNATLGGNGFIGGLTTISSGARLAPGTLTFNSSLALDDGSILGFGLGASSSLISLFNGTLTGPGSGLITVNLFDTGGFSAGTYDLINATGASLSNINSANFSLGTSIPGYNYAFIQSGNRFQVVATVIPEPASALLVMIGAATLFLRRRAPVLSAL